MELVNLKSGVGERFSLDGLSGLIDTKFSDEAWRFNYDGGHAVVDKSVVIDFTRICRENNGITDPEAIVDIKRMAYCWLKGVDGRDFIGPSSVRNKVRIISRFYRAVLAEGKEKICLLTSKAVEHILFDHFMKGKSKLNSRTVGQIMTVVRDLYIFRDWLEDGLRNDPFPELTRKRIVCELGEGVRWSAPDEPSVLLLLSGSLDVIRDLPDLVIPKYREYIAAVSQANLLGLDTKKRVAAYVKGVMERRENTTTVIREPMRKLLSCYNLDRPADLALLIKRIQDACFVVLSYTSGFRASELRRIGSDSLVTRRHINGSEYPYLIARRSKRRYSALNNSSGGDRDINPWIISPGGVEAYKVLVEIAEPVRARSGVDNLWACYAGNGLWPLRKITQKVSVPDAATFNARLNKLARFLGLTEEAGWKHKLHTHMGRKHFARFIVKRDRRGLGALALQYSHTSAISVDISYAMPDVEFRRLVEEELSSVMDTVLKELSEVKDEEMYHSVKGGQSIKAVRGTLLKERDAKKLISSGTLIVPCQWGYCHYESSKSACEGGELPNPANRCPDVCSSCANFFVSPNQAVWWKEYLDDSKKILKLSSLPKQTKELVESRAHKATEILNVIAREV